VSWRGLYSFGNGGRSITVGKVKLRRYGRGLRVLVTADSRSLSVEQNCVGTVGELVIGIGGRYEKEENYYYWAAKDRCRR